MWQNDSSATSCCPGDFPQSFWATEEPRLDVIICENLGPCMWKRLVTWHGNTALAGGLSWSSSAGLRKHLHARHPGGGQGESPSSWVRWRYLGKTHLCLAQLLARRVFSVWFKGDKWSVAEPGQDHVFCLWAQGSSSGPAPPPVQGSARLDCTDTPHLGLR